MNAVNLIPADGRKRRPTVSASPLTLGVIGGLVVALVCAVLYVLAVNNVTTRKSELARVTASANQWKSAADSYAQFVQDASNRSQQLGDVRQLVAGRFPWSQLLSQVSKVMPDKAALSSMQATTPTAASTPASTGSSAATTTLPPTVSISACAASQSLVAQTMVQLHKISGVTSVSLSSATDGGSAPSSSGSGQSGSGACPFPVVFQVSLTFGTPTASATASSTATATAEPTAATTTAAATTTPAASATPATTTPATTTPAPSTTPAAATSAPTTTSGASQ